MLKNNVADMLDLVHCEERALVILYLKLITGMVPPVHDLVDLETNFLCSLCQLNVCLNAAQLASFTQEFLVSTKYAIIYLDDFSIRLIVLTR